MSLRIRLTAATLCTATLVAAIAIIQIRNADADNPQPAATTTQPAPASVEKDSVYLQIATAQQSTQAAVQKVRDALEKQITIEFKDIALKDAVNHIAQLCGISATLNIKALHEEGIADDEPITLTRKQPAPARAVLNTLLEPLALAITIKNERLLVTTEIDAEERMARRLYDVSRLAKAGLSSKAVADILQWETSGPWMNIDGTGCIVKPFGQLLSIQATEKVHSETSLILNVLQRIADGPEKTGAAPLLMIPQDRKVYAALSTKVTADFQKTPLTEVAATFGKLTQTDVLIDKVALSEEGIAVDEPITIQFDEINLKSALKLMLDPLALTYIIEDGVLKITTQVVAEETLTSFVFNVRDFHEAGYKSDLLIESLRTATSGPWEEIDGTGGTVRFDPLPGLLIIKQTWTVLEECNQHIEYLRTSLKQSPPNGQLLKPARDPSDNELTLKQYRITSLPVEDVKDALPKFVATDSWKASGGRGDLAVIESTIIIRQTSDVHQEIADFLKEIGEWNPAGSLGSGTNSIGNSGSGFFNLK